MTICRTLPLACSLLAACSPHPATTTAPIPPRAPIALTYLGVAGWQIEGAGKVVLSDPYLSRPDLDKPLIPDEAAIAAHTPSHADLVIVGHSHADHLLDAPAVAKRTGAQLVGSLSTIRVARASGVADDHLITVAGGEDYELDGYSVRVIPSLHSALDHKHTALGATAGQIAATPVLPMKLDDYVEGGTLAYLLRLAGHEVLIFDTANFIERELVGVHPDIAILAPGLREEVHDYTCRLLHAIGDPPIVIATHFDRWTRPPVDEPPDADLVAFGDEIRRCSPHARLVIPKHFERLRFD